MATIAAIIASTHHPFPFRATTATGDDRPPFADEWQAKLEAFRGRPRPGPPRRARDGRQRSFPPAVAGQHAAVPDRQGTVLRRELLQRGARVRAAADEAARPREPVGAPAARRHQRRLRPGVQQRAAGGPQHHLPDHHPAAAGGPADRAGVHQHLRPADAAAQAVRRAGPGDQGAGREPGPATSGWRSSAPGTCRWSWAGRASSGRTARTRSSTARRWAGVGVIPTPGRGARRGEPGQPVAARQGQARGIELVLVVAHRPGGTAKADYADSLDLFHTMEAYFTWYPEGAAGGGEGAAGGAEGWAGGAEGWAGGAGGAEGWAGGASRKAAP